MFNGYSLDWFNYLQIAGIVLAIALARALEVSNRKLRDENQRRAREDSFEDRWTEVDKTQQRMGTI